MLPKRNVMLHSRLSCVGLIYTLQMATIEFTPEHVDYTA